MAKTDVVRTMRERLRKGRRCMDTVQSDEYVVRVRGVRERQAGGQCTATAFRGPVGRGAGISARTPSTSMGARPLNGRVSRNAGQDSIPVSAPFAERHREGGVNGGALTGIVVSAQRSRRRFRCSEEGQRSLGAEERRLDALHGRKKAARPVVSLCLRSLSARSGKKRGPSRQSVRFRWGIVARDRG